MSIFLTIGSSSAKFHDMLVVLVHLFSFLVFGDPRVDIRLQPHQQLVVDYLKVNKEQKGLLLFHSLGSGKTFAALGVAKEEGFKELVVLLPRFLVSNWKIEIEKFGFTEAVTFITFEDIRNGLVPKELQDFSGKCVIIDEVQRFIKDLKSTDQVSGEYCSATFLALKEAKRLLVLTGTPLYQDTTDIAYIGNLLIKESPYPLDTLSFRKSFMRIRTGAAFFRGQMLEDKNLFFLFGPGLVFGVTAFLGPALIPLMAASFLGIAPLLVGGLFPVSKMSFREFGGGAWKEFAEQYISYYEVPFEKDANFPKSQSETHTVGYNAGQIHTFFRLMDNELPIEDLRVMLEQTADGKSDAWLRLHSPRLHRVLKSQDGTQMTIAGRQIGNMTTTAPGETAQVSPKLEAFLKSLQNTEGQVAVYSNFDRLGLGVTTAFLDKNGFKGQYYVLRPEMSVDEQVQTLSAFNQGKKRILFIHPEITEGISLLKVEHFHLLEPIHSRAMEQQIMGRAVRFRSHADLPKDRQRVIFHRWLMRLDYSILGISLADRIRREHWMEKFSEVMPNSWTNNLNFIDKNAAEKEESPDQRTVRLAGELEADMASFRALAREFSIEKKFQSK